VSRLIDEKGNCYGRLLVLGRAGKEYGRNAAYWRCQCDCGNEVAVAGIHLRYGHTKSCGCLREDAVIDLVGNRYGRLTVIKRHGSNKYGQTRWLCLCDCGNEKVVVSGNLRSGITKSCGCLLVDVLCLPEGAAAFNMLIGSMKASAKRRSYVWRLTDEQVRCLTKQACHYCGTPPSQVCGMERLNGVYIYSGIDRVDNERGYIIDNVVPCCKVCNHAKSTMSSEEFKLWITRAYEHFVVEGV